MDIGFTEEQELLRETARRFLENQCETQFVRQLMAEPAAVTDEFWQKLAEQGWLGIVYPEDDGGSGLGLVDLVVLMEEMGRAVVPGPFLSTVLLGGGVIAEAGTPAQRRRWLPEIAAGNAKAALAWTEPNLRWDAAGVMLQAREAGADIPSPAPSSSSVMRISPTLSRSRYAPATAARWRTASACSSCQRTRPG